MVGQIGDGMVQASLATFVLFSPESQATPEKIAIAFAILLLPYSIFGPFIGVLIDRWPRQRILMWVSILRGLSVLLIGTVVLTGDEGALLGLAVLVSLGIGRFILATLAASLPHVASGRELVTANAFAPTAGTMASAIGGMTGVGVQAIGGDYGVIAALILSACMQVIAASIARTMPRNLLGPDSIVLGLREQVRAVLDQLTAGARHLGRSADALRALLVVVAHRHVFGLVTVMAIVLLRESLTIPEAVGSELGEFTFVVGGTAFGAFIGAVMTPVMVGWLGRIGWSVTTLFIGGAGVGVFMLATINNYMSEWSMYTLIACGAFLGWVGQSVKVCGDSVIQAEIDDDHRGRVFALYDMAVNVGLVSGIALAAFYIADNGRSLWAIFVMTGVLWLTPLLLRRPPSA